MCRGACQGQKGDSDPLGIRVTGSCNHPNVGAEDQTQVLCENRKFSQALGYLSLFFLHIVSDVKLVRSIVVVSARGILSFPPLCSS